MEEFRAYFNEKMSILQKGGKRPEGTGYRPDSGISDKEEEEKEDEEEMDEKLRRAKGSPLESVPSSEESQKDREAPRSSWTETMRRTTMASRLTSLK